MTRRALITGLTGPASSYAGLDWHEFVMFAERHLRPTEVGALVCDASTAAPAGWSVG
jgi:GDP-D-mannose dehydratase